MTNGRPRCLSDRKQNLILFRVYKIICSFVWYDEMIRVSFSSLTRVSATLDQYCLVQLLITSHAAPCQSQDICTCVCRGSLFGAHFQHREGFVFQSFLFGLWCQVGPKTKNQVIKIWYRYQHKRPDALMFLTPELWAMKVFDLTYRLCLHAPYFHLNRYSICLSF